jgi:hypothetical protein
MLRQTNHAHLGKNYVDLDAAMSTYGQAMKKYLKGITQI